ncbi:MAG: ABC transporter substrate-binding protein [Chromatiales bacterium]|nr:ABC transporter substrate-binding protein [Chromatiales bacterium]
MTRATTTSALRSIRIATGSLLLIAILVGACTRSVPETAMVIGVETLPSTLNPVLASDAIATRMLRLVTQSLVELDDSGWPVPKLASWEQVDATHYVFSLGEANRVFHDGTRLHAEDVVALYRAIVDPASGSPHRATLANLMDVRALDADRIEFVLDHADTLFPAYLTHGIVPRRWLAQRGSRLPPGSGPLALVKWSGDERIELKRLDDGLRIAFIRVADPTVRVLKLLRGEIDLLQNDLPPELRAYLRAQNGMSTASVRGTNFAYLGFNLDDPLTGRAELRRAIAQAIDRAAIVRHLFADAAYTAEAIFPSDHWAGAPMLPSLRFDPDAARRLLREAGLSGERRPRLVYKTSANPFRLRLATIVQHQLAAVGIDLEVRSHDWGTFYGDIKAGRFQMYSLAWVGVRTPDIFRYTLHSESVPPAGANRGRLRSAEVDRLIESAERADTKPERQQAYRRLQAIVHEQLPYIPLWYEDHFHAEGPRVSGYTLDAQGTYDALAAVRFDATAEY